MPSSSGAVGTYNAQDGIDLVSEFVHGIPISSRVGARVADVINSLIWCVYPWYWTVNNLTDITCTDGNQDYSPTDTDMLRPLRLQLVRTDVSPVETRELALLANLSPELTRKGGLDTITSAGWYPANAFIRLNLATGIGTGQVLKIRGIYQKTPTKITDAGMQSALFFPDRYFNVFVEGLKWKIYQLADDPRSGTIQYSKNGTMNRVYTGQLGIFLDALMTMARTEDLQAGDEFQYPESGIGVGHQLFPGLYGL